MPARRQRLVTLGRIVGLYGVRGWVKVYSYTRPPENIFRYDVWFVRPHGRWRTVSLREGRAHGKGLIARLAEYTDRDRSRELIGADVAVRETDLPPLAPGEYYWKQLEGLRVVNLQGRELGVVSHLIETGANDVLVVAGERERLVPYIKETVKEVDLKGGVIRVDWDPDF